MEKGCSVANSKSVASATSTTVATATNFISGQSDFKAGLDHLPTTSQGHIGEAVTEAKTEALVSMSKLRNDVDEVHGFAVVLDDESSTSGVLETFDISSSNSLPTNTEAMHSVGVVVAVDDGSSTDTLNVGHGHDHPSEHSQVFFNNNDHGEKQDAIVCIINDDDEAEVLIEEDDDDDEDGNDIVDAAIDCPDTSQLPLPDGTIIAADGSKIFLETPVIEDVQQHTGEADTVATVSELGEKPGKPKRLSDEFMIAEDLLDDQASAVAPTEIKSRPENACHNQDPQPREIEREEGNVASTSQHDKLMSVRLKQMTLTANASNSSSTSLPIAATPAQADTESMDLIERCDFETEQRLTGGIVLRTSSIVSKNKLNLSLINSLGSGPTAGVSSSTDDWPTSSTGRAISSDSKCTYKDLSTTPTSSRKYTNSRLSKSTAKLNLGSSLKSESLPVATFAVASSNAMSTSTTSSEAATSCQEVSRTDGFTNTNSNDNACLARSLAPTLSCHQEDKNLEPTGSHSISFSSVGSQTTQEGGCSRSSVLNSSQNASLDDAQPSTSSSVTTSSARCHYAAATKTLRHVNASAQTQERFLSRTNNLAPNGGAGGEALSTQAPLTRRRRNEIIVLDVVLEEEATNGHRSGESELVDPGNFGGTEEPWVNCDEENNCSDLEEICTCQNGNGASRSSSSTSLSEVIEMDAMQNDEQIALLSTSTSVKANAATGDSYLPNSSSTVSQQRKRKYNEGHLLDGCDYSMVVSADTGTSVVGSGIGDNCRKRIAYDFASTPRSSGPIAMMSMVPTPQLAHSSPLGRRTPRSGLVLTRDNPPPELQHWLAQFQRWSHAERLLAVDRLIDNCDPSQVRHMMKVIEPQFQRDFISLLPRELALFVLSYLEPKDLLRAAQTCRSWQFLCDDNLLWKEKCRKAQILTESRSDRPKRGRDGNMPPISSPWKAAYMRQHIIEMNWRSRPVRKPKVLKGHDDHVITCLQFSGNRIVSGSDDNTLKVWSAVNGKCLRTLVGHTGGVWSSQMSGNIIISGSTDRTLKVWDMESGACVHTLQGHTSTVRCMHLHGSKVVSGSRDATLRVWDIEQGSCLHVLVGHLAAVRCVQYDGKLIVSGAYDYMVKIWHPERQECLHTLQGHTNRVYSLQFDGSHVVSGSLDTSIRVWDVESGNCKHTLMGHQSLTSGMELRQNILVSGNADSTVKVWDITTGQCLQTLSGPNKHQSAVTCLQFNSRFVVTSSDDGTVKLWDVKTGDFIRNLVALDSGGSGGVVWRIRANDTKLICAVGSRNGTEETKLMVLDFDVEGACVKCS
ncbi:uncharacterized protein Dwil_GK10570 [Drosophila willistoni]|uniref:F-box/WD repeat-containing protein 7 n=1 Tax=Drosophila willistoni TaxID=7260 RepID=B4NLZ6_DROWI|nr:F-box/WD repeat-containing protein 7 [Drosophila willistoni]EDW85364.2 uncharacterized protein Dwil_GK10570 [Drosophila willistoni]